MSGPADAMRPYRAPTASAAATVLLDDGTALDGVLHLHADAAGPGGFETVQHLLDDREPFFAMTLASGEAALVRKSSAVEVRCDAHAAPLLPGTEEVAVELVLATGPRRAVRLTGGAPPARRRALDLLNASPGFVRVADGEGTCYVNPTHVRVAYPVE